MEPAVPYAVALFVGLTFLFLLKAFRLVEKAPRVMAISTRVLRDLRDPQLDDDAKEARMREHARVLGGLFTLITGGTFVAFAAPLGLVWLLDAAGILSLNRVLDALASWPLLVGGTIAVVAQLWLGRVAAHGS
jgi:hypothetical protein